MIDRRRNRGDGSACRLAGATGMLVLLLASVATAFGATASEADVALFATRDTLPLTLHLPLDAIHLDRRSAERPYRDARLVDGGTEIPLRLKASGNMRARHCDMPPLKFRFAPETVVGTRFAGQAQLYFTPQCKRGRGADQQLVAEYLAYETFRRLADIAYQVRLIRVTFVDTNDGDRRIGPQLAILTEHQDAMAARYGLAALAPPLVERMDLHQGQAALVALYQFMIGNTDYSLIRAAPGEICCHNTQLVGGDGPVWPVPYDFDQSGLVDADYATPDRRLPIRTVTQRCYRGLCEQNAALPEAIRHVRENEQMILDLVRNQPELKERKRRRILAFYDRFFELLRDEGEVQQLIFQRCH